jgi:hypothetical protein
MGEGQGGEAIEQNSGFRADARSSEVRPLRPIPPQDTHRLMTFQARRSSRRSQSQADEMAYHAYPGARQDREYKMSVARCWDVGVLCGSNPDGEDH